PPERRCRPPARRAATAVCGSRLSRRSVATTGRAPAWRRAPAGWWSSCAYRSLVHCLIRGVTGSAIRVEDSLDAVCIGTIVAHQDFFDDIRDGIPRDSPIEEGRHRDLVRTVEPCRHGAAGAPSLVGEPQA